MARYYNALESGALDKRVTIQSPTRTDDGGGGQTISYTDVSTVWANISPGTGREFVAAQQITPELSHVVTMRYRTTVSPKHRLKYTDSAGTRVFTIQAVSDPDLRHEQLVLYCTEIAQ